MSAEQWFAKTEEIHRRIRQTQMDNIRAAAAAIADSISAGRVVHLFGAGHGSLPPHDRALPFLLHQCRR